MLSLDIPDLKKYPLAYVFEEMNLKHKEDTLWLEFGVASGRSINFISQFTSALVYGFDSFEGLPETWRPGFEKGTFSSGGRPPAVNQNVILKKGWFSDTLVPFLKEQDKKVSFVHIDCDLYSSTKLILDLLVPYFEPECVIVFDELVNYPGFEEGELKALQEFVDQNNVAVEFIGMNGCLGDIGCEHEHVALKILSKSK